MANFERPTPEERIAEWNNINPDIYAGLVEQFHIELPAPYSTAAAELDISSLDVLRGLDDAITADKNLTIEEKFALQHELMNRFRTAVLSKAPEGWND